MKLFSLPILSICLLISSSSLWAQTTDPSHLTPEQRAEMKREALGGNSPSLNNQSKLAPIDKRSNVVRIKDEIAYLLFKMNDYEVRLPNDPSLQEGLTEMRQMLLEKQAELQKHLLNSNLNK